MTEDIKFRLEAVAKRAMRLDELDTPTFKPVTAEVTPRFKPITPDQAQNVGSIAINSSSTYPR